MNVARVLTALGRATLTVLPLGGPTGAAVRADLDASALPYHAVPIAGETRRTVAVIDRTDATLLNEPGPEVSGPEWAALRAEVAARLPSAGVLVLSGSLPRGLPGTPTPTWSPSPAPTACRPCWTPTAPR